jgi:hypothetical protein
MTYRFAAVAVLLLASTIAAAQQPTPLVPGGPAAPPIEATPLAPPPAEAAPAPSAPAGPAPPLPPAAVAPAPVPASPPAPAADRVFCDQNVGYRVVDPATVPEPYRQYVGIFSDASWTPLVCAALIVENVEADGTAAITYVFGPMASGGKPPGGVLHGSGIVKDGALLFQNSDGSQYAFKPFYSDLAGAWTTPKGQSYTAVFKRSY